MNRKHEETNTFRNKAGRDRKARREAIAAKRRGLAVYAVQGW